MTRQGSTISYLNIRHLLETLYQVHSEYLLRSERSEVHRHILYFPFK